MIDLNGFKIWLHENTSFCNRTISNIASRLKRANNILPWYNDEIYLFKLSKTEEYSHLNTAVKSQIKSAVNYYFSFINSTIQKEDKK